MYEVRSLWMPKAVRSAKQKSVDFEYTPKIGEWTLKPGMVLTLSDEEFAQHRARVEKLEACDCVKSRKKLAGEPVYPRLAYAGEQQHMFTDPTKVG